MILRLHIAQMRMEAANKQVGGQAVLGRQLQTATPWLTERHGYDPTCVEAALLSTTP